VSSNKVYAIITERIVAMLDAGTVPWRKGWAGGDRFPVSIHGRTYRGINIVVAGRGGRIHGLPVPRLAHLQAGRGPRWGGPQG